MIDLVVDSRKIKKGDTFIALRGVDKDGHDYIAGAIKNGAARIICEEGSYDVETVIVDDTTEYLNNYLYSKYYDSIRDIKLIGVTGTSGKTTTCFLIYNLLKSLGKKAAYSGTIGFYMEDKVYDLPNTTPSTYEIYEMLLRCKSGGVEYMVMEVSSHSLDMGRGYGLEFDACGFTNISQDHLDYHKNIEEYAKCKVELFRKMRGTRTAVINIDDAHSPMFTLDDNHNVTIGEGRGDVSLHDIRLSNLGVDFSFSFCGHEYSKTVDMVGKYNVYNYIMAVMLINSFGIPIEDILSVAHVTAPPGRMEMIKYGSNSIFVDYAHKPDAVKKVIQCAREFCRGKVITIIGCGGNRDRMKRPIMGAIAADESDFVLFTNDNPRNEEPEAIMKDILEGVQGNNYKVVLDRREAITTGVSMLENNDVLLVLGKGHENYQIVNGVKHHLDDRECVKEAVCAG